MDNREIDMLIQETKDHFIDRSLVFFEKPIEKIMNKTISLYHGSYEVIHDKLKPMGVNVGATKYSKIRWSTYYWDNFESAVRWSVACAVKKFGDVGIMWPIRKEHGTKILLSNDRGISDDELKDEIVRQKIITYVYEIKIPANDIEMGSVASIKEYTISHPVKIYKTHSIVVTKDILDRYFRIVDEDEWKDARDASKFECLVYNRGPILNRILNNHRDPYRIIARKAQRDGLINVGDDLSGYKQKIEHGIKYDTLGLNIKEENSIMIEHDLYEEELLEAVDILVEEYGFDEDEAIDMIAEQFKVSRENMNGRHNIKTWGQKVSNGVTEDEANKHGASNIYFNPDHTYKDGDHIFRAIDHGSNRESFTERRNKYKQRVAEGEKMAKKANVVKNAAIGGFVLANGAYLAHKAYKKYKKNNAKQDLKNKKRRGRR